MIKLFYILFIPLLLWGDAHIFVYHRFDDNRHSYTNTSTKNLIQTFEYFKKHHYKVVKLSTLVKMIKNKENLNKVVSITIDDSFKSFYTNALPIFKKYHYPFDLYVYVEATQRGFHDYMNWKQIKELLKYSGEIALHSYAHPHLTKLSDKEILKDTNKSYNLFTKHMGYKPKSYAYPYGEYNLRVKNLIKKFNFDFICNQNPGAITDKSDIYDLDRIAMTGNVNVKNKLKIKRLNIPNLKIIVKNNVITEILAKTNYKTLEVYITKKGWKTLKTNNGILDYKPNFKLKKFRNRVIIRYNNSIISKMITRS